MEISVKSNVKEFLKDIDAIHQRHVPFVTSKALNAVAVDAQNAVVKSIPHIFNNRVKWWLKQQPTGVKVKFTDKRKGNLSKSSVFTEAWFTKLQMTGGTKTAKRKNFAIPKKENVLDKFEKAGAAHLLMTDKGQYFKTDKAIFRRLKKGRLKYMYALSPTAKIKARFDFNGIVEKVVKRRFEKHFRDWFKKAIADPVKQNKGGLRNSNPTGGA